jgi:predicted N-acetyltransferase YhbS
MPTPPVACQIRSGVDRDADTIAQLINRAFGVEAWFVDGDRTTPGEIRRLLAGPQGRLLLADDGERVIACVYAEVGRDATGYIGLLAVDEVFQGRGLGPWLMRCAEETLAAEGCTIVDITVVDLRAELFPLYERLGYRAGDSLPFPRVSKQPCCLIRMTKALR